MMRRDDKFQLNSCILEVSGVEETASESRVQAQALTARDSLKRVYKQG